MQFLVSKIPHVLSPCLGIFIFGCGGNPSIPDAPPPYPTYSTPSYTPLRVAPMIINLRLLSSHYAPFRQSI